MFRNVLVGNLCRNFALSRVQKRNTVIVTRVHRPPLAKVPGVSELETPQAVVDAQTVHSDDDKWMIYSVDEPYQPHHEVKVILLRNVDDYGRKGQVVKTLFEYAQRDLLLPGLALYYNPENIEKCKDFVLAEDAVVDSSPMMRTISNFYTKRVFSVDMNNRTPWSMEKWHITAALRKHRLWVSQDQLEVPGPQILGPNQDLEGKEFVVVLTINNKEKIDLRCRVHHIPTGLDQTEEVNEKGWCLKIAEPVHEEERERLNNMNRIMPNKKQREDKELAEAINRLQEWRKERDVRLAQEV